MAAIESFSAGDVTAEGTTTIRYNSDGSFLVSVRLIVDSEIGPFSGRVKITSGTSCDLTSPNFDARPFDDFDYDNWQYQSIAPSSSVSVSAFYVPAPDVYGPTPLGKAVLILNAVEDAIGCGVLKEGPIPADVLTANIGTYPKTASELTPTGTVTMTYSAAWSTGNSNDFVFAYDLQGVESDCVECGIHVHSGMTCDDASLVGGHYWDDDKVNDLWTAAGGAVYTSDGKGDGKGYFVLNNGYGYLNNRYHAVTVHAKDGTRIGCGVLDYEKSTSFVYPIV